MSDSLFEIPQKPRWTHACMGDTCQICDPDLPYAGTSGWSGSDTSQARAVKADEQGTTGARQQAVIELLDIRGDEGLTWKELADRMGWHHGTASGALSVLHKVDKIKRLAEKRMKCKVYVLPRYVSGRMTEPHRGNIRGTGGNQPKETLMMTERQADILISGQPTLVSKVARTLRATEDMDDQAKAQRVLDAVADWLTGYRPPDFGDEYCTPLDVTAFILRKGQMRD